MSGVRPGSGVPAPNTRYSPPCDSRFAEGAIRGVYVGAIWGAFFHRYDMPALDPQAPRAKAIAQTVRVRAVGACKHSFLLASFLGLYSGASCAAEKTIGRKNWATSFVGGVTAGTFAGLSTGHPQHAVTWGIGTGMASMIVFALQGQ